MDKQQASMFQRLLALMAMGTPGRARRAGFGYRGGGQKSSRGTGGVPGAFGSVRDRRLGGQCPCVGCAKAAGRRG